MAKLTELRTENNLGFKVDRKIAVADTTVYLRFYNKVTGAATEPNANNRTNLIVTVDKDNDDHEIMILGTVGAASGGVSTCTGVIRFVAFDGQSLTAGTGKDHQSEAEGGCADVFASFWNQLMDVLEGSKATGANAFYVGDETDSDIYLYFANADGSQPYLKYDKMNNNFYYAPDGASENPFGGTGSITAGDGLDLTGGDMSVDLAASNPGLEFSSGKLQVDHSVIVDQSWTFAADAEASDTYAITLSPAPAAYVTGQRFTFTANTANTGAATLNVNSLGAKNIVKGDDSALITGDIAAGQVVEVVYDGTNMVMQSLPDILVNTGDGGGQHYHARKIGTGTWNVTGNSQTETIAHGLGRAPKMFVIKWCYTAQGDADEVIWGEGRYDGTNYATIFKSNEAAGKCNIEINSSKIVVVNRSDSATDDWDATVTTFDGTNVVMTSANYNATRAISYVWEAY